MIDNLKKSKVMAQGKTLEVYIWSPHEYALAQIDRQKKLTSMLPM